MERWKILWLVGFLWLGSLINPLTAAAQESAADVENLEAWDLDYEEAEKILKEQLEMDSFHLGSYIQKIFTGEESFSLDSIWGYLKEGLKKELEKDKNQLLKVVVIAVGAAVFTNFSNVFKNNQVADTGFYVAYLLMFSVLAASFFEISKTASLVLGNLADFMRALAPAFFTAVTMASGTGTSLLFYQIALVVIWLVEMVLVKVILPLIHIYFVLHLLNHLMEKDVLSKTIQMLEDGIGWSLKGMLGLVAGYNFIQGIMLPAADELKRSGLMRAAAAIPGVGNAIGSVTETVLGAGVLVKNAVGLGGIMALLLLMAGPVGKLFCYMLFYRLGASLVQPISDKRILECMSGASKAAKLLLFTTGTGGALFLLTIAIVMSATNLRL